MRSWMMASSAGMAVVCLLPGLPGKPGLFLLSFLLLAGSMVCHCFPHPPLKCLGAFLAGFLWGVLFCQFRLDGMIPQALEGEDLWVTGVVASIPEEYPARSRFEFRCLDVEHTDARAKLRKLSLSWYQDSPELSAGMPLRIKVRLKRPVGYANPGGYDYEARAFLEGISATGYVRDWDQQWHSNIRLPVGIRVEMVREYLRDRIASGAGDIQHLPTVLALTLGIKSTLSTQDREVLRATGTSHLLVISGMHVGLIAGLCFLLASGVIRITGMAGSQWSFFLPGVVALAAAGVYAGLAGFSVPTQRAFLMLLVFTAGSWSGRRPALSLLFVAALFLVLLVNPCQILGAGFWLSFSAVGVLLVAQSSRIGKPDFWRRWLRPQFAIFFGLIPLLALFFNQVSIISPFANLIAIPVITLLVVPAAFLCVFMTVAGIPLVNEAFYCLDRLIAGWWWAMGWLSDLPYGQLQPGGGSFPVWVGLFVLAFLWLLPRGSPGRWMGLLLALPFYFQVKVQPLPVGHYEVTVLDVGQGLSVAVRTRHHWLLYDTGAAFDSGYSLAQGVVMPFLGRYGVNRLDHLMISHGDNDHAGGVHVLRDALDIQQISSGEPEKLAINGVTACHAGLAWEWDGVRFEVLHPPRGYMPGRSNNASCVLRIDSRVFDTLIAGDIERRVEKAMVARVKELLKADLLIVPHHGSNTSSTAAWLSAVDSDFAVISSGYRNRYRHPHPAVVERLTNAGAKVDITAETGALQFRTDALGEAPVRYRQQWKRLWHPPG